jgi:hypothetical protein
MANQGGREIIRRIVVWSAVAFVLAPASYEVAVAQEVCYQDDRGRIVTRRRPGYTEVECPGDGTATQPADVTGAAPPAGAAGAAAESGGDFYRSTNPVSPVPAVAERTKEEQAQCLDEGKCIDRFIVGAMPDRWRIVDSLDGYDTRWWDPYNRSFVKGDKPIGESEWFFNFSLISDTVFEYRQVPTPVGGSSTNNANQLDLFGGDEQFFFNQNIATEFTFLRGDTVFRPPDHEFRFIPVFNINYLKVDEVLAVNIDPQDGTDRIDGFVGIQAAFYDKHLWNVSDRFDFDSIRIGIQPYTQDFRGFLFQDNQLGVRLFGNRNNNIFLYNVSWFRRLEKDTNSGLNDITEIRDDDVFALNLYWQDLGVLGFTSEFSVLYNRNREGDSTPKFDQNGFIVRPASLGVERLRDYDVVYLGYSGDGHFGRFNLSTSLYYAMGETTPGSFRDEKTDISATFAAIEAGFDMDWFRTRVSFLYGSGDDNPYDDEANGFDAVFENPLFAGADTSYWIRQGIPLVGGGRVALSTRNGVLANLRSSKEQGQSNFTNPGIMLAGVGGDADILPQLRLSANFNYLKFDDTAVLEVLRQQADIDEEIGYDISFALTYRPTAIQNVVLRASYAALIPGKGLKDLYPDENFGYFFLNAVLTY